jgi:hypothetical protein
MTEEIKIQMIELDGIAVPPVRMRNLRLEIVDELAESIRARGLLQPIVVRPSPGFDIGGGYTLIAGRHRLAAVKKLDLPSIRAVVFEGLKADEVELIEIDENMIRADLTPAERAIHVARRKLLYENLYPQTKQGKAPGKAGGGKKAKKAKLATFATATSKATGQSVRTIRRDATRAKQVGVLTDIVGTSLDKGDEIDALAKLPAEEQQRLADQAAAGEKVSAKQPAVTAQAEVGQRMRAEPVENFQRAEELIGALQRLAKLCAAHDPIFAASGVAPGEQSGVAANARTVETWLDTFVSNLPRNSKPS